MNGPRIIQAIYAYLTVDEHGSEIIPAVLLPEWDTVAGPVLLPLISGDLARIHAMRRYVFALPELKGKTIRLAKFHDRRVVEVMRPQDEGPITKR
jgi:hypothetical protein